MASSTCPKGGSHKWEYFGIVGGTEDDKVYVCGKCGDGKIVEGGTGGGEPSHRHNFSHIHYVPSHPHYSMEECICGSRRPNYGRTRSDLSCSTCNPPPPQPQKPSTPGAVSASYRDAGFKLSWGNVPGAESYVLKIRRGYDDEQKTYIVSSTSKTVTGLYYGVSYYVSVKAVNESGSSDYGGEERATTKPKTPIISITSNTRNSVTVRLSGMNTSWSRIVVEMSGYSSDSKSIDQGDSMTMKFSGLIPGKSYMFTARSYLDIWNPNATISSLEAGSASLTLDARPDDWEWSNIRSGGSLNTYSNNGRSYAAIVTADEWNDFTERINEFRAYHTLSTFSFTRVSAGDTFTASIYNEARNAINSLERLIAVPTAEGRGSTVTARAFLKLAEALNSSHL